MTTHRKGTIRGILTTLAEHKVAEVMISLIGPATLILGATVIAYPDRYGRVAGFGAALSAFPAYVWGLAWVIPAVWLLAVGYIRRRTAVWPLLILTFVYGAWALAIAWTVAKTVPSGVIIYALVAAVCTATAIFCTARERE